MEENFIELFEIINKLFKDGKIKLSRDQVLIFSMALTNIIKRDIEKIKDDKETATEEIKKLRGLPKKRIDDYTILDIFSLWKKLILTLQNGGLSIQEMAKVYLIFEQIEMELKEIFQN